MPIQTRLCTIATSKRQVFEIPLPKIEGIEHQAHTLCCSCCGKETKADFPEGVEQPAKDAGKANRPYSSRQHRLYHTPSSG